MHLYMHGTEPPCKQRINLYRWITFSYPKEAVVEAGTTVEFLPMTGVETGVLDSEATGRDGWVSEFCLHKASETAVTTDDTTAPHTKSDIALAAAVGSSPFSAINSSSAVDPAESRAELIKSHCIGM